MNDLLDFKTKNLKMNDFMYHTYSWLCNPRNRGIEDFHYSLANSTKADTIEELTKNKNLRNEIRHFLWGRIIQGEMLNPKTVPPYFMSRAITRYITEIVN